MLVDQARQPLERQARIPDRQQQFRRDRITLDPAMAGSRQHIHPPLQAHFAGQRLAHLVRTRDISTLKAYSASSGRR